MARFKEMMKQQYLLVCFDEDRAIDALPALLGRDAVARKAALDVLHRVLAARGGLSDEATRRLARVEAMFDVETEKANKAEAVHA
jgi:hypothetical protein